MPKFKLFLTMGALSFGSILGPQAQAGEYGYIQNGVFHVLSKDGKPTDRAPSNAAREEQKPIYYQRVQIENSKTRVICFYFEKTPAQGPWDPSSLNCIKE